MGLSLVRTMAPPIRDSPSPPRKGGTCFRGCRPSSASLGKSELAAFGLGEAGLFALGAYFTQDGGVKRGGRRLAGGAGPVALGAMAWIISWQFMGWSASPRTRNAADTALGLPLRSPFGFSPAFPLPRLDLAALAVSAATWPGDDAALLRSLALAAFAVDLLLVLTVVMMHLRMFARGPRDHRASPSGQEELPPLAGHLKEIPAQFWLLATVKEQLPDSLCGSR
jgi:hypothetical protein